MRSPECVVSAVSHEPGWVIRKWTITRSTAWRVGAVFSQLGREVAGSVWEEPRGVRVTALWWNWYQVTELSVSTWLRPHESWKTTDPWKELKSFRNDGRNDNWMINCQWKEFFFFTLRDREESAMENCTENEHMLCHQREIVKIEMNCLQREKENTAYTH